MTSRAVSLNSIVAFHSLIDLDDRQRNVLAIVEECPGISAPELYRVMRQRGYQVQENSVSPRLCELVDAGAIKIIGKKINRLTGRSVNAYELVKKEATP